MIFSHWIFGYELKEADSWIPTITGLVFITYSILTRFRHEHFGMISLKTHLILDAILGGALIIVPWLGVFSGRPPYIHSVLGLVILIVAGMTKNLEYKEGGITTPE